MLVVNVIHSIWLQISKLTLLLTLKSIKNKYTTAASYSNWFDNFSMNLCDSVGKIKICYQNTTTPATGFILTIFYKHNFLFTLSILLNYKILECIVFWYCFTRFGYLLCWFTSMLLPLVPAMNWQRLMAFRDSCWINFVV